MARVKVKRDGAPRAGLVVSCEVSESRRKTSRATRYLHRPALEPVVDWVGVGSQILGTMTPRRPYPSDVADEERALVVPYLTLLRGAAGQRAHALREVFNGLRHVVENGIPRRAMPHDLPPWAAVYQQAQRRPRAGCLATLAHDRRAVPRLATGRAEPSAAVPDSRTLRSTPEGGHRAGRDGRKRTRGSKLHLAVDPPGHRLALPVTPAGEGDRAAVAEPAEAVPDATGASVELAFVDQGHTGERPADAAQAHGIALEVVGLPGAKRGVVVLPRRLSAALTSRRGIGPSPTVVERSFARMARCRRPARDHARLPDVRAGLHPVACVTLMPRRAADVAPVHNGL